VHFLVLTWFVIGQCTVMDHLKAVFLLASLPSYQKNERKEESMYAYEIAMLVLYVCVCVCVCVCVRAPFYFEKTSHSRNLE
jgi:hypothetical protein